MPSERNECFQHEEFFLFLGRIESELHRIEELLEAVLRELQA